MEFMCLWNILTSSDVDSLVWFIKQSKSIMKLTEIERDDIQQKGPDEKI